MINLVGCDNVVATDHFKDHDALLHVNVLFPFLNIISMNTISINCIQF